MRIYRIAQLNLLFENNHIDYHNQQNDYNLVAKLDGESVGIIEYSEFDGQIYINNILVRPSLRRQGIGTSMIEEFKRINSGMKMNFGMLVGDGPEFYQSLEMD